MSRILGIDLGTSTTECAVFENGIPKMILNFENNVITPSVVGIDESGSWVAGEKAKAQYLLAPENTAIEVKRKIGTSEMIKIGKQEYTASELSAKLLSYVREYASEQLGTDTDRAVISVPAYFNEIQRRETIEAGKLAGLKVERILNEPTAAALSYGLAHIEEESTILVYDFGGGTFDVTLLEMFAGVLDVKASSGDNQLGGKDFDEAIIQELLKRFCRKTGISLEKDPVAMAKLKKEAELCKVRLSVEETASVLIPAIALRNGTPIGIDEVITRNQFEEITKDLLKRTHKPIDIVLEDAGLEPEHIDHIILVGGSTRMPMIREDIKDYLGIEPHASVNPDYAVAEGAAIQAAIIAGEIDDEEGLIITDVNPYTLGIETVSGYTTDVMSFIIRRNTTIPITRKQTYYTASDYQTAARIAVYQGESHKASENSFLGQFELSGIPPKRAGKESLEVRFSYDLNGMLEVNAVIVSTGKAAQIKIDMNKGSMDLEKWKESTYAEEFRATIRRAERLLRKMEKESDPYEYVLKRQLHDLKYAICQNDIEKAYRISDDVLDLIDEAKGR